MSRMAVSCHLITWGSDFEDALRDVAGLGFHGCEPALRFVRPYASDPSAFADLLGRHGLALSALYETGAFTDGGLDPADAVDRYVAVAELVRSCGSDVVVIGPAMSRSSGTPSRDGLARAAEVLNQVGKRCAELGVRACLHPHLWSEIQDRSEIDAVMEATDEGAVWLCVDSGHQAGAGIDPAELVTAYGPRIGHVHIKDLTIGGEVGVRPKDAPPGALAPFCELGEGSLDLGAFIGALRQVAYEGWITIELDSSTRPPAEALRVCRDYLVGPLGLSLDEAHS
jgi:inosose dehydratase